MTTSTQIQPYTRIEVIDALRQRAADLGRAPLYGEWKQSHWHPSPNALFRHFDTWAMALREAGLTCISPSGSE